MNGYSNPVLRFAKLSDQAFAPTKGSEKAAGFDLKRFALRFHLIELIIDCCTLTVLMIA